MSMGDRLATFRCTAVAPFPSPSCQAALAVVLDDANKRFHECISA